MDSAMRYCSNSASDRTSTKRTSFLRRCFSASAIVTKQERSRLRGLNEAVVLAVAAGPAAEAGSGHLSSGRLAGEAKGMTLVGAELANPELPGVRGAAVAVTQPKQEMATSSNDAQTREKIEQEAESGLRRASWPGPAELFRNPCSIDLARHAAKHVFRAPVGAQPRGRRRNAPIYIPLVYPSPTAGHNHAVRLLPGIDLVGFLLLQLGLIQLSSLLCHQKLLHLRAVSCLTRFQYNNNHCSHRYHGKKTDASIFGERQ